MNSAISVILLMVTVILLLIIELRKQLGKTSNISAWFQTMFCLAAAFIIGKLSI